MSPTTNGAVSGFEVRGFLLREGPFITDSTWIAHESVSPIFTAIAGKIPLNGWWRLQEGGPRPSTLPARPGEVAELIDKAMATRRPAVLHLPDTSRPSVAGKELIEQITTEQLEQAAALIDSTTCEVVHVNAATINAAQIGRTDLTWHLAEVPGSTGDTRPSAVAVDRKDGFRFLLLALDTGGER